MQRNYFSNTFISWNVRQTGGLWCPMPTAHCKLAYKLSRVNIKSNDKRVCQNVREAQKVPQLPSPLQLKAGGRATQYQHQHQDMMWSKIPKYLLTLYPFQAPLPPPQAIISIANVQLIGNGTHSSLHSHSHWMSRLVSPRLFSARVLNEWSTAVVPAC